MVRLGEVAGVLEDAALVLGCRRGADGGAVAPVSSDELVPVDFLHTKIEHELGTCANGREYEGYQRRAAPLATLAGKRRKAGQMMELRRAILRA